MVSLAAAAFSPVVMFLGGVTDDPASARGINRMRLSAERPIDYPFAT